MIKSNKNNKKKKGFTLVELVAVIAIIGILAAVLVPKITGYIKEAKKVEIIDQARKVSTAYESLNIKNPTAAANALENTVTTFIPKTGGLLDANMVLKLKPGTTKVQQCLDILDSEKWTFTLDNNNELGTITQIGS